MDLEDWEILPEAELIQTHDEDDKKIGSREYNVSQTRKQLVEISVQKTESVDNQFTNKKIDFPKFSDLRIYPRIDDDVFELMDECETYKGDIMWRKIDSVNESEKDSGTRREDRLVSMKIWKKSVSGVGAICSSGVAAAKYCAVVLGKNQRGNKQLHRKNQNIRFQISAGDRGGYRF